MLRDLLDRVDWHELRVRAITGAIAIVAILVLANACGSDDDTSSQPTATSTASAPSESTAEPTPTPLPAASPVLAPSYPVSLSVDEDGGQFGTNKKVDDDEGLVGESYDRKLAISGTCQVVGATCEVESLPFSLYDAEEKTTTKWKVKSVTDDDLVLTHKEGFSEDCVWTRKGKPIGTFTTTATGRLTFSEPDDTDDGFVWSWVEMTYKERAVPDKGSDPACTDKRYLATGWGYVD